MIFTLKSCRKAELESSVFQEKERPGKERPFVIGFD
jgi:hypothetical protein